MKKVTECTKNILKKIWSGIKIVLKRFKSPVVWVAIASLFTIIVSTAGYEIKDLTSWHVVWGMFKEVLCNPYILISIAVAIFGFLNNSSDRKNF